MICFFALPKSPHRKTQHPLAKKLFSHKGTNVTKEKLQFAEIQVLIVRASDTEHESNCTSWWPKFPQAPNWNYYEIFSQANWLF